VRIVGVERFEGRGWLEWWANSSTMLASVEIAMVVTVDGRDWSGQGHLVSGNDDDRDGFVLLCELDPVFLLRFDSEGDGDGVPVTVHDLKDGGRRFC